MSNREAGQLVAGDRTYRHVVIVDPDATALAQMVRPLRDAGYQTTAVLTFEEARRQMNLICPICSWRRHGSASTTVFIWWCAESVSIGRCGRSESDRPDPALERDALRLGAAFVITPIPATALVAVVAAMIGPALPAPVDAVQVEREDAAQAALVDAVHAAPVDAVPAAPVDAVQAALVEAAQAAPVEEVQAALMDAVHAAPVDAVPAAPVDVVQAALVDAAQAAFVDEVRAAPVLAVQAVLDDAVQGLPVDAGAGPTL